MKPVLALVPLLAFLVSGCKKDGEDSDPVEADADTDADADADSDADTDADSDADTDPQPTNPGEGSVTLIHNVASTLTGDEATVLVGLFVDDRQGVLNTVECFLTSKFCHDGLPAPDTWEAPTLLFDGAAASYRNVGAVIGLGAVTAVPTFPQTVAGPFYTGNQLTPYAGGVVGGLVLGPGAFGVHTGVADVTTVPPMSGVTPDPLGGRVVFRSGSTVPFTWTIDPSGATEVSLRLEAGFEPGSALVQRLYQLEDDGSFELDVDELGLNAANLQIIVVLARSTYGEVDVNGSPVTVGSRSEAWFEGVSLFLGDRTPIAGADVCGPGAPVLSEGSGFIDLAGLGPNLDPGSLGCTGANATGQDAVGRVVLLPGERVTVRAELYGGDLSMYLVEDCADLTTCLQGADLLGSGAEVLVHANTTGAVQDLSLVFDTSNPFAANGLVLVDVTYDSVGEVADVPDACGLASMSRVWEAGTYTVDLTDAVDNLDPGAQSCTGFPSPGPDRMFAVQAAPGELVRVTTTAPVNLYLLEDCDDETSCLAGALPYGALELQNTGTADRYAYVVLDDWGHPGAQGPFEVTLEKIGTELLIPAADCTAAASLPPLETGAYLFEGTTAGYANLLDLAVPGPSCTSWESNAGEGIVTVRLQPGETMDAAYEQVGGDGVIYLLTTCTDTQSTLACDDQIGFSEFISYTNGTAGPQDLFLVLDSWGGGGIIPAGPFTLALSIQ